MTATKFHLVSDWYLQAPVERVWEEIYASDAWPQWWKAVKEVRLVEDGRRDGVGAVRDFTWTTALPYRIRLRLTATRVEPMAVLEGRSTGDLDGIGRWTFRDEAGGTHLHYDWFIELTKPWQRALAPLLRPVFVWNHYVVMGWGYEGLKSRLAKVLN